MKKLSAILVCLLMVVSCLLSGCAGFVVNRVKYYNTVVAKVGDTSITRFDLLSAYNSYGYYYFVSQQGKSEKEAISSTLDMLIERELLYKYAVDQGDKFKPTAEQINNIVIDIYDSLDSQMDKYYTSGRKYYRLEEIKEPLTADETNTTSYLYKDYIYSSSRRATLDKQYYTNESKTTKSATATEYFDYVINYGEEKEIQNAFVINKTVLQDFNSKETLNAIIETYMNKLSSRIEEKDATNATKLENYVISSFTKSLADYEEYLLDKNGKPFSKNNEDLIKRYFERTLENQIKSQYLTNLNVNYLKNETLDTAKIAQKYRDLVYADYGKYAVNTSAYKSAMKSISTNADSIFYHPDTTEDGTKFGYFIHTLIKFDDTQSKLISALNKNDDDYTTDLLDVVSETFGAARDTNGVQGEKDIPIQTIIDEYNQIVDIDETNYSDRLEEFIQFMFKYTDDASATLVQGMPYVVGNNGYSSMVEAFTNTCLDLMNTGVNGKMIEANLADANTLCITEYGVHFIMYVGPVKDTLPFTLAAKSDNLILAELGTEINPLTHETVFDYLFDQVYPKGSSYEVYTSNNGYDEYEDSLINACEATYGVNRYSSKIKATKTTI